MAQASSLLLNLTPIVLLFFIISSASAQNAPAPAAPEEGPIDILTVLNKTGNYAVFSRLLNQTQVANQINNQVNNSDVGMTLFAPTDNAFQSLKPGALNNLTTQQQVQLVLYHTLPKFYTFQTLATASSPLRTQSSENDGLPFTLSVSGETNQNEVNVTSSSGVETTINNVVRKDFPLAIFQVDKVLWPEEFNITKASTVPPAASPAPKKTAGDNATAAAEPGPADKNGATSLSFVSGLSLLCMAIMGMLF